MKKHATNGSIKIIIATSVILLILAFLPIHVLTIENMYENKTYVVQPFKDDDIFIMKWIHSVELEPWEEWFGIKDNNIILLKTRFKAFGAGVPDRAGEETYMEDDYIVYDKINTIIPSLTYGISPFAQHTLIIKDQEFPLYKTLAPDTGVSINYKKISLIKYLILR